MNNFLRIGEGTNIMPLLLELQRQPQLWDQNPVRLINQGERLSPHRETHDIWLRYKDETENIEKKDYSNFSDPHDGVWYPAYYALPSAKGIIFSLMTWVFGERLGGILLYKIPPGKQIYPHIDRGWHVDFYDKFNVCLQSNSKARFVYEDETMWAKQGDIHWFRNNVSHRVLNEGNDDHIVMTVCIRTHDFNSRFKVKGT